MDMAVPRGNYGVVLSTFDRQGDLDEPALRRELEYCLSTRLRGLLLGGSTGEFVYLTPAQYRRLMEIGAGMVLGKKVLIAGASAPTERQACGQLELLCELGYRYAILCPPYYYPQRAKDILGFYRAVSLRAPKGMGLLLYNIPFCAPGIPLDILPGILQLPNVVGMKDSSGDMLYFSKALSIIRQLRPQFSLFTGQDSTLLSSLVLGAQGCMSSACWLLDPGCQKILEAYDRGDLPAAYALQMDLVRIVRHLDEIPFPENYRALADVVGVACGEVQRAFSCLEPPGLSRWKEVAARFVGQLRDDM